MSIQEERRDKFKQIYRATPIKELDLMNKKIQAYEAALRRIGREGAGFGPAGKVAREALEEFKDNP